MVATNASNLEKSLLGYSEYTTVSGDVEVIGAQAGVSVTKARSIRNELEGGYFSPGPEYIDSEFKTPVDTYALNVTAGADAISAPVQPIPADAGATHGYAQTARIFSFNFYSPFQAAWNWVQGK
jgi:hypothetical protein